MMNMQNMQNNPWLMAMMMQAMQGQQQNQNQGRTPQSGMPTMNPWVLAMLMGKLHPQAQNTQAGMGSSDPANRVTSITDPNNSGAAVTIPAPPSSDSSSGSSQTTDQTNASNPLVFQNPPSAQTGPFSNPTLMPGTVYNTNGRQWVMPPHGATTFPTPPQGANPGGLGQGGGGIAESPQNPPPGLPSNRYPYPANPNATAMAGPGGPPNPGQYPGPVMAMAGNPQIPGGPPNPGMYPPTGVQAYSMFAPTWGNVMNNAPVPPGAQSPWLNSPEAPGGFPMIPAPFAMA